MGLRGALLGSLATVAAKVICQTAIALATSMVADFLLHLALVIAIVIAKVVVIVAVKAVTSESATPCNYQNKETLERTLFHKAITMGIIIKCKETAINITPIWEEECSRVTECTAITIMEDIQMQDMVATMA